MEIALITIWHEKNYGAEMQAYATIKALKKLGHNVKMIDIRLSDIEKRSIKGKIASVIESCSPGDKKFKRFWHKYIPCTKRYRSKRELYRYAPQADIYMVGSDQVWNPDITKDLTDVFFLNFGNQSVRRVGYAPSFGTECWNYPNLRIEVDSYLTNFDFITCREESGIEILSNTFNVTAKCVVDPTLLFSDYSELTGPIYPKNTLVYYPIYKDLELEECAIYVANILGLDPINNKNIKYLFNNAVWDFNSIEGWIKNIAESQFVLTRSFHGIVFSIIYNRQFAVIGSKNNRSTRIINLLSKLGLEDRYSSNVDELRKSKPWESRIDYTSVNEKLKKLRENSWAALIEMIQK